MPDSPVPSLTVTGRGRVRVPPDRIAFRLVLPG